MAGVLWWNPLCLTISAHAPMCLCDWASCLIIKCSTFLQVQRSSASQQNLQQPSKPVSTTQLTPSKRSATTKGADLEALLKKCTSVMFDPELASPFRRTLHTMAHRALAGVADRASSIHQGDMEIAPHAGCFESKAGHTHRPSYSPARHKSAAESDRSVAVARLAAQIHVGSGQMQLSSMQEAVNERKPAHSLSERSARIQDKLEDKRKT